MKTISFQPIADRTVRVPGSKSYTNRLLIAAALSDGPCTLLHRLDSEDTRLTLETLRQLGVRCTETGPQLTMYGTRGRLAASARPLYLGNSGTSMRLLTAVCAIGQGTYLLTGTARMNQRFMLINFAISRVSRLSVAVCRFHRWRRTRTGPRSP